MIGLVGGGPVGLAWSAAFPARTAYRPAQELRLLVLLLREAIAAAEVATGLLLTACRFDALWARLTRRLRILLIAAAIVACHRDRCDHCDRSGCRRDRSGCCYRSGYCCY